MADDINELLGEVESKYTEDDHQSSCDKRPISFLARCGSGHVAEELNVAIHSICGIPETTETIISQNRFHRVPKNRRGVQFIEKDTFGVSLCSSTSHRKNSSYRRSRPNVFTNHHNKRFFSKPVFELSVKDLEAERERRKQKETVEGLFENRLAMVIPKVIFDERKFKRIKSTVWEFFGDVRLLVSDVEATRRGVDFSLIYLDGEQVLLCKSVVACTRCCAVFSYESHSYGTSTLRSHLKSCGKPRFNRKVRGGESTLRHRQPLEEKPPDNCSDLYCDMSLRPAFEEKRINFREDCINLQKQITAFLLSKEKSFETIGDPEFQKLLQMCIKIGSVSGNINMENILCPKDELAGNLLNKTYEGSVVGFTSDMKDVYGVSFSFEVWNDVVKNISYLNMLCHYSDDAGTLKSVILRTLDFPYENKHGHHLGAAFFQCLQDTGLCVFKRILVTDYSSNMCQAFQGEQFVYCINECIDCIVQNVIHMVTTPSRNDDMLEDSCDLIHPLLCFDTLIKQCKSLVLHFKQNKIHDLPNYLYLCTDLHWKPILKMLKSITGQWDLIIDILREREEWMLFDIDEEMMNMVIDFLEIFQDGVMALASLTHPTLNMVIPWWATWKTHCQQNEDDLPTLSVLKSYMNAQIDEGLSKNISLFHKLATMFDPRFKTLEFLTKEDRTSVQYEAIKLVRECELSFPQKKVPETDYYILPHADHISGLCLDPQSQVNLEMHFNSCEIDNYLVEPFSLCAEDMDAENRYNPLKYWCRVKNHYPHLHKIALWILSCPASALRNNERRSSADWMVSLREIEYPSEKMHLCMFSKSYNKL